MDFLDPRQHRRHVLMIYVGYAVIGLAILIGTIILMNIAYGFGLGKNGQVVQNGFMYLSTYPSGADIRLNGKLQNAKTNARLSLPGAAYHVQLDRDGYKSWQRDIVLEGGSVMRFDYPLLIPSNLKTTDIKSYTTAPTLAVQSPDRRWLLVQHTDDQSAFDMYDLKSFDSKTLKQTVTSIAIPADLITSGSNSSWQLGEWSTDNQHVLLQHLVDGKTEFIVVDRTDPTKSINLTDTLKVSPTKVTLRDKKYDQYYLYDATSQILSTASLNDPAPVTLLDHVLNYQSYGSDIVLYASSNASSSDKVAINLLQGGKTYSLRETTAGTNYLLNITRYSGSWYVAVGASSENKVYIYKNPVNQLSSKLGVLTPVYILKTEAPTYLAFSSNAQYIMDENGTKFSVYDAEYDKGYTYDAGAPIDTPQQHASWMDGNRLTYVSGGKLLIFDYDHTNAQTLVTANPNYLPFFDTAYKFVDVLNTGASGKTTLINTSLRIPADQ